MNGYTDLTSNIENSRNCLRRIARHDDQEFSKESIINVMEKFVKTVNSMDETILIPCRLMDRQVGDATDTVPSTTSKSHNHNSNSSNNNCNHHHHHHHHGCNKKKNQITVHDYLNSSDLFNLYNMLNTVKVNLLWGKNADEKIDEEDEDVKQTYQHEGTTSTTTVVTTAATAGVNTTVDVKQQQDTTTQGTTVNTKGHIRRPSTVSMASSNSVSTLSDTESEISNENDSGVESEGNHDNDKSIEMARQFRQHLHGLYRCLEQMTEAANYLTARYQSDVGTV